MRIISFFSFKGGVGRTALLTSLGAYWAGDGRKVAMIDMDLAAPGLSLLPAVGGWLDPQWEGMGVGDALDAFFRNVDQGGDEPMDFVPPTALFRELHDPAGQNWSGAGRLLVIDAGRPDVRRPATEETAFPVAIPPKGGSPLETQRQWNLRSLAQAWRDDLAAWRDGDGKGLDFVLIDCRTGFPELLDLTLGYLSDEMVLVSGINPQNVHGLGITMDSLMEQRIRPGSLPAYLTVVLSPIPANDDEQTLAAIDRAYEAIERRLRPLDQTRLESGPRVLTLPYSSRVASGDPPFPAREGRRALPYHGAVRAVARHLERRKDAAAELRDEVASLTEDIDGALPSTAGAPEDVVPPSPSPVEARPHPMADLPPWHWPFDPDETDIGALRETLIGKAPYEGFDADGFLTLLCYAISLGVEQKKDVLAKVPSLSRVRVERLQAGFEEERSEILRRSAESFPYSVARSQMEWGEVLGLGAHEAQRRFLVQPVEGRTAFRNWDSWPEYWNFLGYHLDETLEESALAETSYRRAIDRDPHFALPWNNLGNLLQDQLGRYEEAEAAYRRAIELDAKDARPWVGLGNLLQNHLGRYEEAEAAYRRAIELDAKYALPWNNLGNLLQDHLGRYEEAEAAYRRAIELDAKYALPWNNLGNLLKNHLGRYEEAEAAYRRAIELDAKDALPWNGLGNLLQDHLGRYEEAETAYRRAIELDAKYALPWNNLGNLLQNHLGRYEEAEAAYRRAIELDAKDALPWNGLGNLLQNHLGRYEEAEAAYRRAIELDAKYALPWNNLGNLLQYQLGRYEEADAAYRRAIELDAKDARPWNDLGNLLQDHLGRYEEAETAYRRAIDVDPKLSFPWNGLALLLRLRGRIEQALSAFDHMVELERKGGYGRMNRGRSRFILGDGEAARADVAEAVRLFAAHGPVDNHLITAVLLGDGAAVAAARTRCRDAMQRNSEDPRWPAALLLAACAGHDGAESRDALAGTVRDRLRSHNEWIDAIDDLYDLAGWRPDAREAAREAARVLWNLPDAVKARFRDVPKPDFILDRYRPFIEGRSDGAGDPRDLPLWCKDAEACAKPR